MVGVPAPVVVMMRLMPWVWHKLEAVAHTLPYDAAVMRDFKVPTARLATITIPTLAMHGSKTDARLQQAAEVAGCEVGFDPIAEAEQRASRPREHRGNTGAECDRPVVTQRLFPDERDVRI